MGLPILAALLTGIVARPRFVVVVQRHAPTLFRSLSLPCRILALRSTTVVFASSTAPHLLAATANEPRPTES